MNAAHILAQHPRAVLFFSAGKDSLACLLLLRPFWHHLTVAWSNPGAAHPQTRAYMDRIKAMVPTAIAALGLIVTIIGLPWITEVLRGTDVVQAAPSQGVAPDTPASAPSAVPQLSPAPFPASAPGSTASG